MPAWVFHPTDQIAPMPQVKEGHYHKMRYLTLERWISYYFQIKETMRMEAATLLEIGVGNGIVASVLRSFGVQVTTCDFDVAVHPDIVADVRKIPVQDGAFDAVMACQILEHLPWEEVPAALSELARVTKRYAIISLPCRSTGWSWMMKLPGMQTLFRRTYAYGHLQWPIRFPGFAESGQHYWEIDTWQVSVRDVKRLMAGYFEIKRVFRPPMNAYHVFFVLEKRS